MEIINVYDTWGYSRGNPVRHAGWHGTMSGTVTQTGGEQTDKYGTFVTGDGNFVVYDRENPDAWIQSDYALDVGGE
jgi:hypothetical protein